MIEWFAWGTVKRADHGDIGRSLVGIALHARFEGGSITHLRHGHGLVGRQVAGWVCTYIHT
jgi:hypothetical protein